jgi:hypothetical protein
MKRLLLIVFLAAQVTGVHAARQYRNFTDTQGRTIRGCVVAYDERSGVVTFERDNRRTAKVPLSIFSEESQNYICSWKINKLFLTDSGFRISVNRRKSKDEKESYQNNRKTRKVEVVHYEILLENRANMELKDLNVEYCIYYEQDQWFDRRKVVVKQGVRCGELSVGTMPSKSKKTLQSEAVKTHKDELSSDRYFLAGESNVQRGKIHGIWIRIHTTLPSGKTLTRNYSVPESLSEKMVWEKSSTNVGLN